MSNQQQYYNILTKSPNTLPVIQQNPPQSQIASNSALNKNKTMLNSSLQKYSRLYQSSHISRSIASSKSSAKSNKSHYKFKYGKSKNSKCENKHQKQDLCSIAQMVSNQVYMEYKDYLAIKQFYLSHSQLFINLKDYADLYMNMQSSPQNILSYVDMYKIVLITAKFHYLQREYQQTIATITKMIPLQSKSLPFYFNFLYQRQLLLLKCAYLLNPLDSLVFQNVKNQYYKNVKNCIDGEQFMDADVSSYYDGNFQQIYKQIKIGSMAFVKHTKVGSSLNLANDVNVLEGLKKLLNEKVNIYQGIPIFLLSKCWALNFFKFVDYLTNKNSRSSGQSYSSLYPGPALNLQLLNHLFQFEIHTQQNKVYMDTLIFPVIQNIDYIVVTKKTWKIIQSFFGGLPIMRYPIKSGHFTETKTPDTLAKMILQSNDKQFILQWQIGTYWDKTVIPTLGQQFLGPGQLKQIVINYHNNTYYKQIKVVKSGTVDQSKNRYKYIQFNQTVLQNIQINILNKMKMYYDFQVYYTPNAQQQNYNEYSMGLLTFKNINNLQIINKIINTNYFIQKNAQNLSNISYQTMKQYLAKFINIINPFFICIGQVQKLMQFYYKNNFIANLNNRFREDIKKDINKQQKQCPCQFSFAFEDLVKKLWFSSNNMPYLQNYEFIKEFFQCKMVSIQNDVSQSNIKKQFNFTKEKVVSQLFSFLHSDINKYYPLSANGQQIKANRLPYFVTSLQTVSNYCIVNETKINDSYIKDFASVHSYNLQICDSCKTSLGYRYLPNYTLNVDIPSYNIETIKLFLIFGTEQVHNNSNIYNNINNINNINNNDNNNNNNPNNNDGDIPKQMKIIINNTEQTMHQSQRQLINGITLNDKNKKRGNKVVQQISIKTNQNSKLLDIYKVINNQFKFYTQNNQSQCSYNFITFITDQNIQNWQCIDENKTVKQIIALMKDSQKWPMLKEKKLSIFLSTFKKPAIEEQLFIVSFRNDKTKANKGFPQIITVNKTCKSKLSSKSTISIIKQALYNYDIQIQNADINSKKLKDSKNDLPPPFIKSILNLYTSTKMGNKQRTAIKLTLQTQDISLYKQNYKQNSQQFQLQDLIHNLYYEKAQYAQQKFNYELCNKKWTDFKINEDGTILCRKCNNTKTQVIGRKLLTVGNMIIISLNRENSQKANETIQKINYPLDNLNIVSNNTKNRKSALFYDLKGVIFPLQNQTKNDKISQNSNTKTYGCIVKHSINKKWYLFNDESIKQIKREDAIINSAQILIYQQAQKNEKAKINQQ